MGSESEQVGPSRSHVSRVRSRFLSSVPDQAESETDPWSFDFVNPIADWVDDHRATAWLKQNRDSLVWLTQRTEQDVRDWLSNEPDRSASTLRPVIQRSGVEITLRLLQGGLKQLAVEWAQHHLRVIEALNACVGGQVTDEEVLEQIRVFRAHVGSFDLAIDRSGHDIGEAVLRRPTERETGRAAEVDRKSLQSAEDVTSGGEDAIDSGEAAGSAETILRVFMEGLDESDRQGKRALRILIEASRAGLDIKKSTRRQVCEWVVDHAEYLVEKELLRRKRKPHEPESFNRMLRSIPPCVLAAFDLLPDRSIV